MARQIQTNFRTTPEMKMRLQAAADANGTTFNKELNRRLAESFADRRVSKLASGGDLLRRVARIEAALFKQGNQS